MFEHILDSGGVASDHVNRVHAPRLPDPIIATDALLEPDRVPRKLQVDHQAAAAVQIEAFRRRIRRKQHSGTPVGELALDFASRGAREAPVQHRDWTA